MMYILCVRNVTSSDDILRRLNVVATNTYLLLTGESVPMFTLTPASGGRDYPVTYFTLHIAPPVCTLCRYTLYFYCYRP